MARDWKSKRFHDLLYALIMALALAGDQSAMAIKRQALGEEIRMAALMTGLQTGVYDIDPRVIRAMAQVPRHRFINQPYSDFAYYNVALPVEGQDHVIPEPFISAMMIHLMDIQKDERVLDIGYGPGYDAAVMAKLAGQVHAVTYDDDTRPAPGIIMHKAGNRLGWAEDGPYDAILVRQSMAQPPLALLRQLKPGGKLVLPVGAANAIQTLTVYTRKSNGHLAAHETLSVKIAPLLAGSEI